ncbi:MAG: tetratricopeptide repeat protein [Gammaproteobacteria bacterium]
MARKAATRNVAAAENTLGVMYDNGYGVPLDYANAREWFGKAAAQGYARAQYNLGLMYSDGKGVPRNTAQALYWWKKAAAGGDRSAQRKIDSIQPSRGRS